VVLGLVVLVVVSFGWGRYVLTPWTVVQVFLGQVITIPVHWTSTDQTVILQIRLPRILGALLVGAVLAASGAAYQTTFRNPLVSPEILGVAAAAGFGASLALLLGLAVVAVSGGALRGALAADSARRRGG
jgi:iron complex transport system permease protein